MAFSSMRQLGRSGRSGLRPLLRTQFERTHLGKAHFVRSLWEKSRKIQIQNDMEVKLTQQMVNQGILTRAVQPHTLEVVKVWSKQIRIFSVLTDLNNLADIKLTLSKLGLLASLYKHGPGNTWRVVAQRMKGKSANSDHDLDTAKTWLDAIEPFAKEISKVLIVHQKQKKSVSQHEETSLNVFPHDFGSILIKISQLRLKWNDIASLRSARIVDEYDTEDMEAIELLIKEVHETVVVKQLLEQKLV